MLYFGPIGMNYNNNDDSNDDSKPNKFNEGDLVLVKSADEASDFYIGKVGKVVDYNYDCRTYYYGVAFDEYDESFGDEDGCEPYFREEELEKI